MGRTDQIRRIAGGLSGAYDLLGAYEWLNSGLARADEVIE